MDADVTFQDIPGLPGFQQALVQVKPEAEKLQIISSSPNVFQVVRAENPTEGVGVILINNVGKEMSTGEKLGALVGVLLDYIHPKDKTCWSLTVITVWPNGHATVEINSGCS
jgi:hypothetical protein